MGIIKLIIHLHGVRLDIHKLVVLMWKTGCYTKYRIAQETGIPYTTVHRWLKDEDPTMQIVCKHLTKIMLTDMRKCLDMLEKTIDKSCFEEYNREVNESNFEAYLIKE